MNRYFNTIRKYSWTLLVCMALATAVGFVIAKGQPPAYQATTIDVVESGAAGTNVTVGANPQVSVSQSNDEAIIFSAQIQGREFLQTVYDAHPDIKARGYTVSDLLLDVAATSATATSPSTSSSTGTFSSGPLIFITVTTPTIKDTVLVANAVATGFVAYATKKAQDYLASQRASLTAQIQTLQKQSDTLGAQITAYPSNDPHAGVLTANRAQILGQIDKAQVQLASLAPTVIGDVFVSQLVDASEVQSSSKGPIIIAASAGVGLLLGILAMLLLIFLDNGLYNYEHVKEKLEMAYLGGVPKERDGKAVLAKASGAGGHRQLSDIRTNLQLTGILPNDWRMPNGVVLLVTSPRVAEGKTTFAAALAATMARNGGSVVVVDGNLRQPTTHLAFGAGASGAGISALLKGGGRESVDDIVVRTQLPNVWLVPGGTPMDDPTLSLAQKLPAILSQLRKKADLIIIDGPALLTGADASLLATMVDGVALVIDGRYAKLSLLRRAKELLKTLSHKRTGIVVNRVTGKKLKNQYFALAFPTDDTTVSKQQVIVEPSNGHGKDHPSSVISGNGQQIMPAYPPLTPAGVAKPEVSIPSGSLPPMPVMPPSPRPLTPVPPFPPVGGQTIVPTQTASPTFPVQHRSSPNYQAWPEATKVPPPPRTSVKPSKFEGEN